MMDRQSKEQFKKYYEEQFLKYNEEFIKAQENGDTYNEQIALANMQYYMKLLNNLIK